MFGYVKPCVPELKVRDHELYKATYCGLCRTMGKNTGCVSKFTLSYDFVFLALLRMASMGEKAEVKMRRCLVHPFKKRPMLEPNESLKFSARAGVILTKSKLKDNINDSRGLARIKAKIVGLVSVFLKKAPKNLIPLQEKINACIDELTMLEKENSDSLDKTANTFGDLLGYLASFGIEGPTSRIVYDIAFHLGKLIYIIDACDDFESDKKTDSFNVIKNAFGNNITDETKEILHCSMTLELEKMSRSVELLDFSGYKDVERILKNITYIGMPDQIEKILKI
ncbi:MAG: hypothetical protein IJ437_04120 [Clostridia bacterium]|nr:hypothetical protein [Clostridia bacterium]